MADNPYQRNDDWTKDMPEGQLEPNFEKGGHVISLLAKLFGMGGALEGNWSGRSSEGNSPMYGTKWGEAPIADILGAAPWPVAGAITKTGIIPTAMAAAKSRAALAESAMPSYAAIGKSLQNAPGIAENAWNLGKEGIEGLLQKLRGLVPEGMGMEPAMAGAAQPTTAAPYRSTLHKLLGKHEVIIPYIPKSTNEPLLLKTPEDSVRGLTQLLGQDEAGWTTAGQYQPLWNSWRPKVGLQGQALDPIYPTKGDLILSRLRGQESIIPHEFSHYLQDLISGQYSHGIRPEKQTLAAQAKYFWPISKVDDRWIPLSSDKISKAIPGREYGEAAAEMWNRYSPTGKAKMREAWGYGSDDELMQNELVAELTNPQALADRFRKPLEKAESFKATASERWPALREFWNEVPDYIPENAYDIPVWNQRLLGLSGQGASRATTSNPYMRGE